MPKDLRLFSETQIEKTPVFIAPILHSINEWYTLLSAPVKRGKGKERLKRLFNQEHIDNFYNSMIHCRSYSIPVWDTDDWMHGLTFSDDNQYDNEWDYTDD